MVETCRTPYYPKCTFKNCWLSVAAHFQDGAWMVLLSVSRNQPAMILLWLPTSYGRCDYPGRVTRNSWRHVDTTFHDGAGRVLQSVLPTKADKILHITECKQSAVWLPMKHDQKLLTLCWSWFSGWGREGIAICFAYKDSQKFRDDSVHMWLPRTHEPKVFTLWWVSYAC